MRRGIIFSGLLHAAALSALLGAWHLKGFPKAEQLISVEIVVKEAPPEITLEPGPDANLAVRREPRERELPALTALERLPALPQDQTVPSQSTPLPQVAEERTLTPQERTPRAEPPVSEPVQEAFSPLPPRRKPPRTDIEPKVPPVVEAQKLPEVIEAVRDSSESRPRATAPEISVQPQEVSPAQLLANLKDLQDEDLQARKNPELWAVIRAVRAQVARCWSKKSLAPDQIDLTVDIRVAFDAGGILNRAEFVEVGRMVHDETYRDFAVTARDALRRCSPFALPPENYDLWRDFTMRFVSRFP